MTHSERQPEVDSLGEIEIEIDGGVRVLATVLLASKEDMPRQNMAIHMVYVDDDGEASLLIYISRDWHPDPCVQARIQDEALYHEATEWFWRRRIASEPELFRALFAALLRDGRRHELVSGADLDTIFGDMTLGNGRGNDAALDRLLRILDAEERPDFVSALSRTEEKVEIWTNVLCEMDLPRRADLARMARALSHTTRAAAAKLLMNRQPIATIGLAGGEKMCLYRVLAQGVRHYRSLRAAHMITCAKEAARRGDSGLSAYHRQQLDGASHRLLLNLVKVQTPASRAALHHPVIEVANDFGAGIDLAAVKAYEAMFWRSAAERLAQREGTA